MRPRPATSSRRCSRGEQVFGAEHPETLGNRDHLAGLTGQAGDPAEARDQYAGAGPGTSGSSAPNTR